MKCQEPVAANCDSCIRETKDGGLGVREDRGGKCHSYRMNLPGKQRKDLTESSYRFLVCSTLPGILGSVGSLWLVEFKSCFTLKRHCKELVPAKFHFCLQIKQGKERFVCGRATGYFLVSRELIALSVPSFPVLFFFSFSPSSSSFFFYPLCFIPISEQWHLKTVCC